MYETATSATATAISDIVLYFVLYCTVLAIKIISVIIIMFSQFLPIIQVNQRQMHKYEQESKKQGKASFAYAWVLDETGEERQRYEHSL